jgi:hypothetical protein
MGMVYRVAVGVDSQDQKHIISWETHPHAKLMAKPIASPTLLVRATSLILEIGEGSWRCLVEVSANVAILLQVIAVICILVWVINIGRFGDAMHGGWVSSPPSPSPSPSPSEDLKSE